MPEPVNQALRQRWRKWLFRSWVAAAALIGLYVGIGGPVTSHIEQGREYVALALPALMIFMLTTGAAWLVLLVLSRPRT